MGFDSGASIAKFLMFAYNISTSQAQAIAPGYVHVFGCHTQNVAAFRAGNPSMDLGIYIPIQRDDGIYGVDDVPRPLSYFIANHPDWIGYLADKATPAYQFGSPATPLDQSNPGVQSYQLNSYAVPASASGAYTAISVDNVILTNDWLFSGVYAEATPGSQFSGLWTQLYSGVNNQLLYATNIINWLQSFGPQVRALNPKLKMIGNFDPGSYGFSAAQTASVLAASDGLVAEFGFTHYGSSNQSGATWLGIVNWMKTVQQAGKPVYIVNQLPYPTTQSDVDYAFASYLMCKYQCAALYICPQSSTGNPLYGSEHLYPHYSVQLGAALTDMALTQGVYMRRFAGGRALVNPDSVNSYTVYLPNGASYTDVYGNSYTGSVMLAPLRGLTLLNPKEYLMNNGQIPVDNRGIPVLALWNDATSQVIPVHVGSTVVGADGQTYAILDVKATVTATNPSVGTDGSTAPASSTQIGASDGTNLQPLQVDASKNLKVNIAAGSVTASNPSVGTDGSAIPTSSTLIGASDGTNLQPLQVDASKNLKVAQQGNVTETNSAGIKSDLDTLAGAVSAGKMQTTVTNANSNGQSTMANSAPVAIASDQSAIKATPYKAVSGVLYSTTQTGVTTWAGSGDISGLSGYTELYFNINFTSFTGTSVQFKIQRKDSFGNWISIDTGLTVTATGSFTRSIGAGLSSNQSFGNDVQVVVIFVSATVTFTLDIYAK